MTEFKKGKVHPPKFKKKAELESLGGMTINQITKRNSVYPTQLGGNGSERPKSKTKACFKANVEKSGIT